MESYKVSGITEDDDSCLRAEESKTKFWPASDPTKKTSKSYISTASF